MAAVASNAEKRGENFAARFDRLENGNDVEIRAKIRGDMDGEPQLLLVIISLFLDVINL